MTHNLNRVCRKEPQFDTLFICSAELLYLFWMIIQWDWGPVCLCLIILLHASQKPAYNGHYVFNLLREVCVNLFELIGVFGQLVRLNDWFNDSLHSKRHTAWEYTTFDKYVPYSMHVCSMNALWTYYCTSVMLALSCDLHCQLCCYASISSSPVVSLDNKLFSYKCSQ